MHNEKEAAGILLEAYKKLDLEEILDNKVTDCVVRFEEVPRPSAKSCLWMVENSTLKIEIYDTTLNSGVEMVRASFVESSMRSEDEFLMRYPVVPSLIILAEIFGIVILAFFLFRPTTYIYASISLGLGLVLTPILFVWNSRVSGKSDEIFIERLSRVTNLDISQIRISYREFMASDDSRDMRYLAIIEVLFCLLIFLSIYLLDLLSGGH